MKKKTSKAGLIAYNEFCKEMREGTILYNVDQTNSWGDFLLVANRVPVHVGNVKTYVLQLLGLKKEEGEYIPRDFRISFTPDLVKYIPFLKYVGHCKFELLPVLKNVDVNLGLVSIYCNTDLHQYTQKLKIRKPQRQKYGSDGRLVIKQLNNE